MNNNYKRIQLCLMPRHFKGGNYHENCPCDQRLKEMFPDTCTGMGVAYFYVGEYNRFNRYMVNGEYGSALYEQDLAKVRSGWPADRPVRIITGILMYDL